MNTRIAGLPFGVGGAVVMIVVFGRSGKQRRVARGGPGFAGF